LAGEAKGVFGVATENGEFIEISPAIKKSTTVAVVTLSK